MIRATNYDPLPCLATTADRHRQTPENGFERSNYRVICASVERHRKCLLAPARARTRTDTVDSLSPSLLPFFPLSTRSLAPRIAGWLISGVAKRHQCPSVCPRARPSVPCFCINRGPVLSSLRWPHLLRSPRSRLCWLCPLYLPIAKKRVARPFTRLSLCCLSSHFYRHKWPFLN